MPSKRIVHILFFCLGLFLTSTCVAQFGQTLQINTRFSSVIGKPTWLLIIRNERTGKIIPYMFDIRNNDNFWLAFTDGDTYRITVSNLKWGPYAIINNFCCLENGILIRKSMILTLKGKLSPYRWSSTCHVTKYKDMPFPILNSR